MAGSTSKLLIRVRCRTHGCKHRDKVKLYQVEGQGIVYNVGRLVCGGCATEMEMIAPKLRLLDLEEHE